MALLSGGSGYGSPRAGPAWKSAGPWAGPIGGRATPPKPGGWASLDYGFRNYPVSKLLSLIHPANRASQKVAERLGETKGGPWEINIAGGRYAAEIWEITREDWEAQRHRPEHPVESP